MAESPGGEGQAPPGEPGDCLLLASGCHFEGLLVSFRAARIEGCLRGPVRVAGLLEIGAEALVEGDLEVESLVVAGQVRGAIRARHRVELGPSAVVEGEIHAPGVAIAEGSRVDARCRIEGRRNPHATSDIDGPSSKNGSP